MRQLDCSLVKKTLAGPLAADKNAVTGTESCRQKSVIMDNLNSFAHANGPLPLDTAVAVQLLDLFRDPDHDVDRIVELISQDPFLANETLKRCNNAFFRGKERTTDIFEAVSRLGFYEIYDIVSASTDTFIPSDPPTLTLTLPLRPD